MADQVQERSEQDNSPGPQKLDMAAASAAPPQPLKVEAAANPEKQPPLPLGLGLKDAQGVAQATTAPAAKQPPKPEPVKPEPADKPDYVRARQAEPAGAPDLSAITEESKALRSELGKMRAEIEGGRTARRLQELRAAGVQMLTDSQLLSLAPKVDPDTAEGKGAINKWLSENEQLISPRYRTRPSPAPQIMEKAEKQSALMNVFGDAATLQGRLKQYFEE